MLRAILVLVFVSGCASVPTMREFENNNCNNEVKDVVTLVDRAIPNTCVEEAEIVQLPTYQQLQD